MRPKARVLAWTGVQHSLAGERGVGGKYYLMILERSLPLVLAGVAQLLATGNDSCCFNSKCCQRTVNTKIPQGRSRQDSSRPTLGWSEAEERGERSGEEGEIYYYFSR
jgi:hypothetical protein